MSIGSPELDPSVLKMNEASLISRLGLNPQDAGIIKAAALAYGTTMTQAQATIAGIAAGKQALSDVDRQQVAAVSASLDQAVSTSAAQIFATARPSTVALLRSQAAMVGVPLTTVGMAK